MIVSQDFNTGSWWVYQNQKDEASYYTISGPYNTKQEAETAMIKLRDEGDQQCQ